LNALAERHLDMGKSSIYTDLNQVKLLQARLEIERQRCDALRCKERPVEGSLLCKKHKTEAEKHFEVQMGIDPLWHMKHDVALKYGGWAWIYFVGNRDLGIVKIGYTTKLKRRMASLRTGSPVPIKLFAVIFADASLETRLHEHFKSSRKHGEWFTISADLEHCIDDIKNQRVPDCVPAGLVPTRDERIDILAEEVVRDNAENRDFYRSIERREDCS